jgi:hypothetical protein
MGEKPSTRRQRAIQGAVRQAGGGPGAANRRESIEREALRRQAAKFDRKRQR